MRGLLAVAVLASLAGLAGCGGCGGASGGAQTDAAALPDAACPSGQHDDGSGGCTSDPCLPNPCVQPDRGTCVAQGSVYVCRCDAGTHEEGAACVPDQSCLPTTCSGHGTCSMSGGGVSCACDAGWTGAFCQDCAGGYHPDGQGGCTTDPCTPDPCTGPDRHCVVTGAGAECLCKAGTHDEGGNCVPDEECYDTTCSGHGTCSASGGGVACACATGWAGAFCDHCDDTAGYHDDGAGGCTTDPCTPNPCVEPHRTVCTVSGAGDAVCGCVSGYHDEGGSCVLDEACQAGTCHGHGTCSVVDGRTRCACDPGYVGEACDQCDAGAGYHDDGAGGCTTDPCAPNPCTSSHKTVCTPVGQDHTCTCDAGYHDDGAGGCTDDPCTPNPCLVSNQACRVVGGGHECYTPACDDGNSCTHDEVVGGGCSHTDLDDATPCQTSLCLVGQTCQGGHCAGGAPPNCNDGNPCTRDSCDPAVGCRHDNDDTLVPDDGIDCTVDACAAGVPSHTPSNARCDDGLWCTGEERCEPANSQSDARGCRHVNVPQPAWIPPSPCRSYGACDEGTHSFPIIQQPTGTQCSDGMSCTSGDACDAHGVCRGTAVTGCLEGSCSGSTPLASTIDIPVATVAGTITLGGAPLPATYGTYDGASLYLVSKDTGAWHTLASYSYWYQSGGSYVLHGDTYATRMIPGTYDLLYRRYWDRDYNTVTLTSSPDTQVNGLRLLQTNVVIGLGPNVLDVDIPVGTVSGSITLGGAPLPATYGTYDGASFYLVSKDTGAWHNLAAYSYWYQSGGSYVLHGDTYATRMIPGTYDLLYRRYWDSEYNTVTLTSSTDTQVNGLRLLQTNVVVPSGASTLNLDIPVGTVSGSITLGGAPLPATYGTYDGASFYLVSKDTGAWHNLAAYSYWYQSGGSYVLHGDTYATRMIPGTYDLLYRRYWDSEYNTVTLTSSTDTQVNGLRLLQTNVVVPAGASTLNLDIPVGTVSGSITLGGAPLPATYGTYDGASFYLVSKDTGAWHNLASYSYWYQSGGSYVLHGDTYATRMIPGTYDLLYRRYWDSEYNTVTLTSSMDTQVNGLRLLQTNVVVPAGASTLNLDIPVGTVSGSITLGGAPLPATYGTYDGASFYLVSKDTGAWHNLASYSYWYQSGGSYVLHGDTYATRMIPGTYDLLYRRYWDSEYNTVTLTSSTDTQVNGLRVLQTNVVVPAGASTLDLDIPVVLLSGNITMNGGPLPATYGTYDGATIYLVPADTGAWHTFAAYSYWYQSGGSYVLHGDSYSTRMIPGVYDVLYRRYWDSDNNIVSLTDIGDTQVNGLRDLRRCVALQ